MPYINSSSSGSGGGRELSYTALTGITNIVSQTEATGTTIFAPGAIVFDGAPVLCELFCYQIRADTAAIGDNVVLSLFEAATQITRMLYFESEVTGTQRIDTAYAALRFTPTAGSHTYTITAFAISATGTPSVVGGTGGTSGAAASYLRFVKV